MSAPKSKPAQAFKYKPQFGLIIKCESEAEQKRDYEKLRKAGFQPKVVCV